MATVIEVEGRPVNADSPSRELQKGDIVKNPGAVEGFPVSKSEAATLTEDEIVVLADTDGGVFTLTLPEDQPEGRTFVIKNVGSSTNDLTVETDDSATIDGSTSVTVSDGDTIKVIADSDGNFFDIN